MKTTTHISALTNLKVSALAVSLALSSFVITGCGSEESTTVLPTAVKPALSEVVKAHADDELSFNGVVRSAQRADLAFRIGGRLTYIFVKEGDQVKQGQLLAKLDDRDAQTAFESAQLELKNARAEYQRGKAIFEKSQAIAKSDLDTLTTRFNLAQNRLEEAKRQLEYTQLKAPFDGIVGRKMVDNHVQIQANMPIIAIHDVQNLEVVINIPDTVMLYGLKETKAKAELSSIPGKDFALKLRTFATQADPVTQTYAVVLGFEDLKGFRVLPGMAVKVSPADPEIKLPIETTITVPLTAVVPDNQGKQFVWVVNDKNHVEKRYVKVGALSSSRIEITECLVPGERIIIAGVASLKDGMQVRPYTDDNSGA
ncbi:efflux RND transporter periplasmic adaptor subunit [Photobacterium damselae]|uniref:efflux RND transporter periplasmic adaptor subunit n=1 Tax=Photobacterium damselae TaxID=38293 RepID=UPI0023416250|nr:efflux RND transporter periplasmic adaptor subunit [Photobacterium damselae]MDC4170544.1 efflux RND transporter periplasmic adaptor subunit [Photobacterium damselae]